MNMTIFSLMNTFQKRRAVWRLAHDVRGEGAAILLRLWDSLGWPEEVSVEHGAVARYGVCLASEIKLYVQ
jgi:hypothetical protein